MLNFQDSPHHLEHYGLGPAPAGLCEFLAGLDQAGFWIIAMQTGGKGFAPTLPGLGLDPVCLHPGQLRQ
jgi:hypothetical protein